MKSSVGAPCNGGSREGSEHVEDPETIMAQDWRTLALGRGVKLGRPLRPTTEEEGGEGGRETEDEGLDG
jgi:hypothetical protein